MNGNEVMNTVNKPMSLVKEEFTENLIKLINESGMPLFVTESILKDIMVEFSMVVKQQAEIEKAQYEQMLKQQVEQNKENVVDAEKK